MKKYKKWHKRLTNSGRKCDRWGNLKRKYRKPKKDTGASDEDAKPVIEHLGQSM